MFIAQPDIPVPLTIDFAFPAWATGPSAKGVWSGTDDGPKAPPDPFQAIPGAHDDPPPFCADQAGSRRNLCLPHPAEGAFESSARFLSRKIRAEALRVFRLPHTERRSAAEAMRDELWAAVPTAETERRCGKDREAANEARSIGRHPFGKALPARPVLLSRTRLPAALPMPTSFR